MRVWLLLLAVAAVNARSTHRGQHNIQSTNYHEERRDDYSPLRYYETRYSGEGDSSDEDDRGTSRGGSPVKSGVTPQQIQQILDAHNKLRAGEGAANMEVLKWNAQLATLGQQWADRCNFEHGQPSFNEQQVGYKQMGQNLWAHTDPAKGVDAGVQAWFDEKADFTFDSLACRPGKMCGHYTQVVWSTSREVGCGLTNCSEISGMKFANYLVCNYGPAGNWASQKPYKKGPACSACDSGKFFCTNKLCDFSCSSAGSSSCKCEANCGKCGTKTNDCKCQCKPGWSGVACSEECKDKHQNCGGNPGWPASWCDPGHQFVLDNCPKLCKKCNAATGGETCSLKTYGRKSDSFHAEYKDSDESEERGKYIQMKHKSNEKNSDDSDSDRKSHHGKDSDDSEDRKQHRDSDDSEDRKQHRDSDDDSEDKKRRRYFIEAREDESSDDRNDDSSEDNRGDSSSYERHHDDSSDNKNEDSSDNRGDSSSYERNDDSDDDRRLSLLLARVEKLMGKQ